MGNSPKTKSTRRSLLLHVGMILDRHPSAHDGQTSTSETKSIRQDLNTHKREDLLAATPPLEVKKILVSMAVTEGVGYQKGCKSKAIKLDFIDVRRAYFHAKARRLAYVKLPPEDDELGKCGKLVKALYGARDAAQNW